MRRLWEFVVQPPFVGALLVVAGLIVALAPTASVPEAPSQGWWVAAYRFANAAQSGVTLLLVAGSFAGALAFAEFQRRKAARQNVMPLLGAATMGLGILLGVGSWFGGQTSIPTSRVSIAPGQTIEAFGAIESGRAFKVMLPNRIFVDSVDPQDGRATIELRKAGEESGVRNDIFVGDPLEVGDYRIALVGLELDPRARTAVLTEEGGIEVRASVASKVRFIPDGPEYEVKQITLNYIGVMGPAVELLGPDGDRFWVFQRDAQLDKPLAKIRLLRLEAAPVPVFAIAPARGSALGPLAALCFLIGFFIVLVVRDRGEGSIAELGPSREHA